MTDPSAAPPAQSSRKQNPAYHVFLLVPKGPNMPSDVPQALIWEQLTPAPVAAGSRKAAVETVLARLGKLDEKGPFMVVPAKECWRKSKRTETTKTEVWS